MKKLGELEAGDYLYFIDGYKEVECIVYDTNNISNRKRLYIDIANDIFGDHHVRGYFDISTFDLDKNRTKWIYQEPTCFEKMHTLANHLSLRNTFIRGKYTYKRNIKCKIS